MVLKFEDFVNEGLWAKGIERSKTGEVRLENKIMDIYNVFDEWHKDRKLNFNYRYENINNKQNVLFTDDEWKELRDKVYDKLSKISICEDITDEMNEKPNSAKAIIDEVEGGHCVVYTNEKDINIDMVGKIDDDDKNLYITNRYLKYNNDVHASTSRYTPKDFFKYHKSIGKFYKIYRIPNDVYLMIYNDNTYKWK